MDGIGWADSGTTLLKKYRYPLLAVILGILLLTLPDSGSDPAPTETVSSQLTQPSLEEDLSRLLSLVNGAGKVELLLTQVQGEETVYQTDEDLSSGDRTFDQRSSTVLITGEDRLETGLVRQINAPVYRGAVVLCQGADDPKVCLSIVEAVRSVTGLTSDKITVLKMK